MLLLLWLFISKSSPVLHDSKWLRGNPSDASLHHHHQTPLDPFSHPVVLPMSTVAHQPPCRETVHFLCLWWQHNQDPRDGSPVNLHVNSSVIRWKRLHACCALQYHHRVFNLLYRVWSEEPRICPSPPIRRCSPGLTAYRCLNRTTWLHSWVMWKSWSDSGKLTTPATKNRAPKETMTTWDCMILHHKGSGSASPCRECSLITWKPYKCGSYQLPITLSPKSSSQNPTTTPPLHNIQLNNSVQMRPKPRQKLI